MSAKPPAALQGIGAQGLPGQGALPPPQGRKPGRGMARLTHPSSGLPHSPALGLQRGVWPGVSSKPPGFRKGRDDGEWRLGWRGNSGTSRH